VLQVGLPVETATTSCLCVQVAVRKGDTIGGFLKAVREQLAPQFRELRAVSVDNMMYVKVRDDDDVQNVCYAVCQRD